ncbi:3'-5' exoribonuclease YhaM family protein [Spiroplasma culicicola]|uniref:3'-5' exoribonuclease YhaM n=1 Tax=Spiroplasma culicicola AES-1 TaxID=1276246 RepID=W6AHG9_9MOLU|nr:HD domain-containing protein [Spiroplasma culicicola]AHI53154.1 3'-5' exoribonuclease YhaM [Spiroplasma culicicola AES-1]
MKIFEINSEIKSLELVARVERVILSTGNNGSNYLIVNLVDKTGRIEARLWNADEKDVQTIKVDSLIKIDANVNLYRQQLQLKINHYQIIEEKDYSTFGILAEEFAISAPIDVDKIYDELITLIDGLQNGVYQKITKTILQKYEEEFKTYPAATSIHHNLIGGLIWHSYSLVKGAMGLKEVYNYADIDWELIYCGATLHDIGKVIEMKGKTATEYTDEGKLLGHISIGNTFIASLIEQLKLNEEQRNEAVKLQHIILSSHGKNEFGSPIEPIMIEGVIVSSLDALDARIYKINDELSKVKGEGWTSKIFTEEGKSFLKHFNK